MFVVYNNSQFVSLEKEGEKRLGRRKKMTKMGKGEKTQRRRKGGKRQSQRHRGPRLYPGPCWLPLSFPAPMKSYHSKPQHGIRTYSKLFIAFMETDSMSPFLLQNSNEQLVLLMDNSRKNTYSLHLKYFYHAMQCLFLC